MIKIGTHNGLHHPDDVTACLILSILNPENRIIRTRDREILSQCDYLVDIGGEYDARFKFDHHQKGAPVRDNGVPYSASGLVWKDLGHNYIEKCNPGLQDEAIEWIWNNLDQKFFLIGDMLDNHMMENNPVDIFNTILSISNTTMETFKQGMSLAEFHINFMMKKELNIFNNNEIIKREIIRSKENNLNYVILPHEMDTSFIKNETGIFFAIFPYSDGVTKMIRCLAHDNNSLSPVYPFKDEYRGLLREKITDITSNPSHLFVHHKGFCAGSKTIADAIGMIDMTDFNNSMSLNIR